MRRVPPSVLCFAVALAAAAPGSALAAKSAAAPDLLPPTPLPGELPTLLQRASTLKLVSMRFEVSEHVQLSPSLRRQKGLAQLLALLADASVSGETTVGHGETLFAEATFTILGGHFTLRFVGHRSYLRLPRSLARRVHGIEWVALGSRGLEALEGSPGSKAPAPKRRKAVLPASDEPPFASLRRELEEAHEVREVGATTVDGQAVTEFVATLEPSQLEGEQPARPQVSLAPARRPPTDAKRTTPPTGRLYLYLAASGLPVELEETVEQEGIDAVAKLTIPAVNFPLVLPAPPPARTISLARLRAIEKGHPR